MREILFRGKRADNDEWIEGYYAVQSNHACFAHELKYTHFIFKDICLDFNLGGLQEFEVIPETIGQYTGLTDKNSKKIFEGDILKVVDQNIEIFIYKVVFTNGVFGTVIKNGGYACALVLLSKECIEVIGNIHDNPELLEKERENNER